MYAAYDCEVDPHAALQKYRQEQQRKAKCPPPRSLSAPKPKKRPISPRSAEPKPLRSPRQAPVSASFAATLLTSPQEDTPSPYDRGTAPKSPKSPKSSPVPVDAKKRKIGLARTKTTELHRPEVVAKEIAKQLKRAAPPREAFAAAVYDGMMDETSHVDEAIKKINQMAAARAMVYEAPLQLDRNRPTPKMGNAAKKLATKKLKSTSPPPPSSPKKRKAVGPRSPSNASPKNDHVGGAFLGYKEKKMKNHVSQPTTPHPLSTPPPPPAATPPPASKPTKPTGGSPTPKASSPIIRQSGGDSPSPPPQKAAEKPKAEPRQKTSVEGEPDKPKAAVKQQPVHKKEDKPKSPADKADEKKKEQDKHVDTGEEGATRYCKSKKKKKNIIKQGNKGPKPGTVDRHSNGVPKDPKWAAYEAKMPATLDKDFDLGLSDLPPPCDLPEVGGPPGGLGGILDRAGLGQGGIPDMDDETPATSVGETSESSKISSNGNSTEKKDKQTKPKAKGKSGAKPKPAAAALGSPGGLGAGLAPGATRQRRGASFYGGSKDDSVAEVKKLQDSPKPKPKGAAPEATRKRRGASMYGEAGQQAPQPDAPSFSAQPESPDDLRNKDHGGDADSVLEELMKVKTGAVTQEAPTHPDWGEWELTRLVQGDDAAYVTPDNSEDGSEAGMEAGSPTGATKSQVASAAPPADVHEDTLGKKGLEINKEEIKTKFNPKKEKKKQEPPKEPTTKERQQEENKQDDGVEGTDNWEILLTPDTQGREETGEKDTNLIGNPAAKTLRPFDEKVTLPTRWAMDVHANA